MRYLKTYEMMFDIINIKVGDMVKLNEKPLRYGYGTLLNCDYEWVKISSIFTEKDKEQYRTDWYGEIEWHNMNGLIEYNNIIDYIPSEEIDFYIDNKDIGLLENHNNVELSGDNLMNYINYMLGYECVEYIHAYNCYSDETYEDNIVQVGRFNKLFFNISDILKRSENYIKYPDMYKPIIVRTWKKIVDVLNDKESLTIYMDSLDLGLL